MCLIICAFNTCDAIISGADLNMLTLTLTDIWKAQLEIQKAKAMAADKVILILTSQPTVTSPEATLTP